MQPRKGRPATGIRKASGTLLSTKKPSRFTLRNSSKNPIALVTFPFSRARCTVYVCNWKCPLGELMLKWVLAGLANSCPRSKPAVVPPWYMRQKVLAVVGALVRKTSGVLPAPNNSPRTWNA